MTKRAKAIKKPLVVRAHQFEDGRWRFYCPHAGCGWMHRTKEDPRGKVMECGDIWDCGKKFLVKEDGDG